jgi:hypothetical protein
MMVEEDLAFLSTSCPSVPNAAMSASIRSFGGPLMQIAGRRIVVETIYYCKGAITTGARGCRERYK